MKLDKDQKIMREYTYGPFNSRRLGLSLGINILPKNAVCTYDCVYCELGKKPKESLVSPEFRINVAPTPRFKKELHSVSKYFPGLNSMSFSGYFGEPTLNKCLLKYYHIAREVRNNRRWQDGNPYLTIFTNSSTLYQEEIRDIVKRFDLVLAKLDTATKEDFLRTNRPHNNVPSLEEIVNSIAKLRKQMGEHNKLALQCLIYQSNRDEFDSNNNKKNIESLAYAIKKIKPDAVQLYSIARAPAEYYVYAIDQKRKEEIVALITKIVNDPSLTIKYY
jgi:wyosine [tRNA(Phe)-imidazoG37] synthetase (radical SAM superfamily)